MKGLTTNKKQRFWSNPWFLFGVIQDFKWVCQVVKKRWL